MYRTEEPSYSKVAFYSAPFVIRITASGYLMSARRVKSLPTPSLERVGRERRSPRMRATRIKPGVERALFASATPGQQQESRKPTGWALDASADAPTLGRPGRATASVTRSAGSMDVCRFPRVPLRASLRSPLRFTLGSIRIARLRGLTLSVFPKLGVGKHSGH